MIDPVRQRPIVAIGCVLFLLPLLAHAYAGTASRYVGDDYCAGYIFQDQGFAAGQRWFYLHWGAVPATVFLIALTNPIGVMLTPLLTTVALVMWVAAATWAISRLFASLAIDASLLTALLLAELIVFATVHDAPNIIQSLYLRVPMFEYVVPLVLLIVGIGLMAAPAGKQSLTTAGFVGWCVLAFVAGNFGPTYAAMQATACVAAMALNRIAFGGARRVERVAIAATLGSIAALAAIALAPGNAARQTYFPPPPSLAGIAKWTVLSTAFMAIRPVLPLLRPAVAAAVPHAIGTAPPWLPIALAMTSSPLTLVLLAGIPMWLAMTAPARDSAIARRLVMWLPVVAILLVMACMAPSAYGTSSPPPPRTLIIPQFVIASLLAAWGYALGIVVPTPRARARWSSGLLAALVAIALVVVVRSTMTTGRRAAELRSWAARWDETDRQLRSAAERGVSVARVPAVGSIGGVGSIAVDPSDWVNACAAKYYRVQQIVGVEP